MSILRRDVKQKLHKNLGEMVAYLDRTEVYLLVINEDLSRFVNVKWSEIKCPVGDPDHYTALMIAIMQGHPHILSGERFDYDKSKMKNPQGKIHTVVKPRDRVGLTMLDHNDWNWLKRTIRSHAVNIHFHKNPTQFGSYLGGTADMKWVKWEVTDCVFAAMLNVMGLRFEGSGDVEAIEKKIEEDLAVELSIPKTAVEDHTLILLMESKLGWRKLLEVTDLASLLANTVPGKKYIVSYCENTTTDFWHTIYAERKTNDFKWVDRQYERKEGKVRTGALKGDPASEAVCWEVDEASTLLDSLKFKLKVDTLASTHAEHLG